MNTPKNTPKITPEYTPNDTPKKTRTPAQQQAARENGAKSQGPITPEGKARSRQNALKHGCSSREPRILPPNLCEEVIAEVHALNRSLKPQNHAEQRLVEVAALATARHHRLTTAELRIGQHLVNQANQKYRAERKLLLHRLTRELSDPNNPNPSQTLFDLQQTSHGCRILASRYDQFARALEEEQCTINSDVKNLLLAFAELPSLRVGPARSPDNPKPRARAVAALFKNDNPDLPIPSLTPAQRAALPDPDAARRLLVDYFRERALALRACARKLWRTIDRAARNNAHMRDLLDASPEGKLLKRYIKEAFSIMNRSIEQVRKLQKSPNNLPPANEPDNPQHNIESYLVANTAWPDEPDDDAVNTETSAHIKNHPPNGP